MITNWTRRGLALGGLCALAALMHAAGSVLSSPPLDPADLTRWWSSEGPVVALVSLLRLVALAGSCWLAAITTLDCVAVAVRIQPLQRLTRRVAPAAWRNLVFRPMALSAVAAPQVFVPVATMSPVAAEPIEAPAESDELTQDALELDLGEGDDRRVLEMRLVEPSPPLAAMSLVEPPPEPRSGGSEAVAPDHDGPEAERAGVDSGPDPDSPTATKAELGSEVRHEPEPSPEVTSPTEVIPVTRVISMTMHAPASEVRDTPSPQLTQNDGVHVVASGENLWSIAATHLAAQHDTPVAVAEVASYWQRLIDANHQALPDPENPDLLYRGVELRLPPI